jgi:CubicO group peptidase (beta-lactamase class C family)
MRPAALVLAFLLALLSLCCRSTRLEPDLRATQQALNIPSLSVAVARDGKVVFVQGGDTRYPIGSITKTFTSTLMLQLAEEGKLDLDAPVAPLVDFPVDPAIRIRQVLSHTSEGRFAYSSRFNWLDNVVEGATRDSFARLLNERVLQRAGLTRTVADNEATDRVEPYRIENGTAVRSQDPPLGLHSSSGLSSTVLDLIRYSNALDDGRRRAAAQEQAYTGRPYGLGWFVQDVAGERVIWHTSWWPDAYSGLLVRIPSRRLTLAVLANTDGLVAPQGGAADVLLYPAANAFLRAYLGQGFRGETLVASALTERARGNTPRADALLREAVGCCDLSSISDDDRLRLFSESAKPAVRAVAVEAAQRLLAAYPNDLNLRFNAALLYGRVRPSFTINGPEASQALTLLQSILAEKGALPKWMNAWSSYLVAEHTADRALAERAKATGVNTDGLQERVAKLLGRLP